MYTQHFVNRTVPEIFDLVREASGSAEKVKVLRKYMHDPGLMFVLSVMYGERPFIIAKPPKYIPSGTPIGASFSSITTAVKQLERLREPTHLTPARASVLMTVLLESVHEGEAKLLCRLIEGKRITGITFPLVQQAFPNLYP